MLLSPLCLEALSRKISLQLGLVGRLKPSGMGIAG
jgi:hypothetical protein